jgi:hypothetical protein
LGTKKYHFRKDDTSVLYRLLRNGRDEAVLSRFEGAFPRSPQRAAVCVARHPGGRAESHIASIRRVKPLIARASANLPERVIASCDFRMLLALCGTGGGCLTSPSLEFSHILQFKEGSTLRGAQRELHADYMAGYYLGRKSHFLQTNIANFADSPFEKGDYAFWSQTHHGTPQERVAAMVAGFENRNASLDKEFSNGEDFVGSMGN